MHMHVDFWLDLATIFWSLMLISSILFSCGLTKVLNSMWEIKNNCSRDIAGIYELKCRRRVRFGIICCILSIFISGLAAFLCLS